jgi:hypothetical protein
MWSNQQIVVDRKSRSEPLIVARPFVSVFGGIQPQLLRELRPERQDGFLDRFLCAYPEPRRPLWSEAEISAEARQEYASLYEKLAALDMMRDEHEDPQPGIVVMAPEAKKLYGTLVDELRIEAYCPGFPVALVGVWRKLEAYLARLALILALCRISESGSREQVEEADLRLAATLIGYFKNHAKRVHSHLHGENPRDLLAQELEAFLGEQPSGEWEGEPSELLQALIDRGSEAVPERPDELSKAVLEISGLATWLKAERGWGKKAGKSHRTLRLYLRNGVDGVVGVDPEAG